MSANSDRPVRPVTDDRRVEQLVGRHFDHQNGELVVGDVPISRIIAEHGTPLFVYDQRTLQQQWQALRDAFPARFDLFYSVKANPNQAILRFFLARGCGLEIASEGELRQALAAGCQPERIFFAGPGKSMAELEAALGCGIGEIHVESLVEARRIADIARRSGRRARIALRVNPAGDVEGGSMRMGGRAVPFGIDEDQLDAVVDELLQFDTLDVCGLHLFMGTQILDHEVLLKQYRAAIEIARRLGARLRRPLETVDFGGGLGVPYFPADASLDLVALRAGLDPLLAEIAADPLLADTRFVVEPGRFLAAPAGIYLVRVTDIKDSRGKRFVITDGGMHQHLAASGNLGQTIKRNFPVAVANKLSVPAKDVVDVVGPLCTPLDVLARGITMPPVEIGDTIAVFQSGAYARAASPLGFLSHPSPAEVWVAEGNCQLIRRRGSWHDYLSDQVEAEIDRPQ